VNISNSISDADLSFYDFDHLFALNLAIEIDSENLDINTQHDIVECKEYPRRKQTKELLLKLEASLLPCSHDKWLQNRGVHPKYAFSLDYEILSLQDLLDLYVIPNDFIIERHGLYPIEGPVFPDWRDGQLVGICIRNVTKDLDFAADEKFTVSNHGWYLFGFDDYASNDPVYLVEGVFDAIAMRENGLNAIGLASAYPTAMQLACLSNKYNNLRLCLDNDFWGHVGSYIIAKHTGFPAYFTEAKDPGSYSGSQFDITKLDLSDLEQLVREETSDYNMSAPTSDRNIGHKFRRPLPYN